MINFSMQCCLISNRYYQNFEEEPIAARNAPSIKEILENIGKTKNNKKILNYLLSLQKCNINKNQLLSLPTHSMIYLIILNFLSFFIAYKLNTYKKFYFGIKSRWVFYFTRQRNMRNIILLFFISILTHVIRLDKDYLLYIRIRC